MLTHSYQKYEYCGWKVSGFHFINWKIMLDFNCSMTNNKIAAWNSYIYTFSVLQVVSLMLNDYILWPGHNKPEIQSLLGWAGIWSLVERSLSYTIQAIGRIQCNNTVRLKFLITWGWGLFRFPEGTSCFFPSDLFHHLISNSVWNPPRVSLNIWLSLLTLEASLYFDEATQTTSLRSVLPLTKTYIVRMTAHPTWVLKIQSKMSFVGCFRNSAYYTQQS